VCSSAFRQGGEKEEKEEKRLAWTNPEGGTDGLLEGCGWVEHGNLDSQEEDGDVAWWEWRKADGIFFGGNEGEAATSSGAGQSIFDLRSVEAMMIGEGSLVDDFSSEFDKAGKETFGHGYACEGPDAESLEIGERLFFSSENIFEVKRVMAAGMDGSVKVMAANGFF
jgi:hypothetical protein